MSNTWFKWNDVSKLDLWENFRVQMFQISMKTHFKVYMFENLLYFKSHKKKNIILSGFSENAHLN